ncbi:MAG: hypothetical protein FRX49_01361 [Trebouxia sp. A1-2]|nr:MAG: hypothetical protein FRX49_01361 [Trebouxia sp. A1-2]
MVLAAAVYSPSLLEGKEISFTPACVAGSQTVNDFTCSKCRQAMKRSASATPLAFLLSHALSFHLDAQTCHKHTHITTPQAMAGPGKLDAQYGLILSTASVLTSSFRTLSKVPKGRATEAGTAIEAGSLPLSVARFPDLPPTSPGPKSDSLRVQAEAFWGLGIFKGGHAFPCEDVAEQLWAGAERPLPHTPVAERTANSTEALLTSSK